MRKGGWIKVVVFVLCLLFSLLFVPRVLRSDTIAGDKQKIGWVEFCYSAGMVLGLVAWTHLDKLGQESFQKILYYNVGFQALAGLIDIYSSRLSHAAIPSTSSSVTEIVSRNCLSAVMPAAFSCL